MGAPWNESPIEGHFWALRRVTFSGTLLLAESEKRVIAGVCEHGFELARSLGTREMTVRL